MRQRVGLTVKWMYKINTQPQVSKTGLESKISRKLYWLHLSRTFAFECFEWLGISLFFCSHLFSISNSALFLVSCLFCVQVSGPVSVSEGHEVGMCWAWSLLCANQLVCCQEAVLWGCGKSQTAACGPKAGWRFHKGFVCLLTPGKLMGLSHLNQPSACPKTSN